MVPSSHLKHAAIIAVLAVVALLSALASLPRLPNHPVILQRALDLLDGRHGPRAGAGGQEERPAIDPKPTARRAGAATKAAGAIPSSPVNLPLTMVA